MTLFQPAPIRRVLAAMACLGALAGCGALSAVSEATAPLDVYELRAPDGIAGSGAPRALDVIVELPTTSGALATDRIMIRPDRLRAQYLPEVRWADPVPVMVQTLMLRAIEAAGAARYVGRTPLGIGGDYALVTEVVDFQADRADEADTATVRLTLIVRMVRETDARIVASRTFTAASPAATTETSALVTAFNAASDSLLLDLAEWVRQTLPRR